MKAQIREVVFSGLSSPIRAIRSACAVTISELAHCDWPDEWPELTTLLLGLLSSGQPDAVHGALRVLTDFVKTDLAEDQLLPIAQTMLPALLHVLNDIAVSP